MRTKLDSFLPKLSADAQLVAPKIKEVVLNEDLTFKDTCERINTIASQTTEAVRQELRIEVRDCSTVIQTGLDHLFNGCNNGTGKA